MLLRSALLRRYPNAVIYLTPAVLAAARASRARPRPTRSSPVFAGSMQPDVKFFGFDLTVDEVVGSGGAGAATTS